MTKIVKIASAASLALVLAIPAMHSRVLRAPGATTKSKAKFRCRRGGYRHVVIIKNKTRDWLNCEVWTDVDPQPPHSTRVGPRNTREVVIRTRAEEDEFIPYGYCRNN